MTLILPQRRMSQPQVACGVDWSNPAARGLTFSFIPCIARNFAGSPGLSSAAATVATRSGVAAQISNTGPFWEFGPYVRPAGDCTLFTLVPRITNSRDGAIFTNADYSSGGVKMSVSTGSLSLTIYGVGDYESSFGVNQVRRSVAISVKSSGLATYFADGFQVFSTSVGAISTPGTLISGYSIGSRYGDASNHADADVALALYWNRALSAPEMASIDANPWQLFKPAVS